MDELPKYKITIDDEYNDGSEPLGLDAVALTSTPAIIVKGVAFSDQKRTFSDDKKYRITAPAMIPKDDIYRKDEGGEYYVEFTVEEIDAIHKDFMSKLSSSEIFNLEHESENKIPAYLLEAWIVSDPKTDKAFTEFGIEVPQGSLMMTLQFTDQDYYNKMVEEGRTGLSIEGFLGLKLSNQKQKYMLPDGEHLIDGKIYVVKDGVVVEVKEVEMAEEPVADSEEVAMEEVAEETKEEEVEMAEEVVEETTTEVEAAVDPAMDSEAILAIVTPLIEEKVNEVLQVIADLKNELTESVEGEPTEEVEMNLSAHQRFSNIVKFLSK